MTATSPVRKALPLLLGLVMAASLWQPLTASALTPGDAPAGRTATIATDSGAPVFVTTGEARGVTHHHGALEFGEAGGALGVNTGTRVVFGDTNAPSERFAFTIVNRGTQPRDLEIAYDGSDDPDRSAVTFRLYDGSGGRTAIVNDTTGPTLVRDVSPDTTVFVVVVVDTNGVSAGTTLSGTLRISTSGTTDSTAGTDLPITSP